MGVYAVCWYLIECGVLGLCYSVVIDCLVACCVMCLLFRLLLDFGWSVLVWFACAGFAVGCLCCDVFLCCLYS